MHELEPPRPLASKLGINPGTTVWVVDPPAHYLDLLQPLPVEVSIKPGVPGERARFIHYFTTRLDTLKRGMPSVVDVLDPNGQLWISWPKKRSPLARGLTTDLHEQALRDLCLPLGLVDTKVCAIDDNWSALKFVWRMDRR